MAENVLKTDSEELPSCSECVHRQTLKDEQEFCNYYREEIPEGVDWGDKCSQRQALSSNIFYTEVNQSWVKQSDEKS